MDLETEARWMRWARVTWGCLFAGLLGYVALRAAAIAVLWESRYADVVGPVLRGESFRMVAMGGDSVYTFVVRPDLVVVALGASVMGFVAALAAVLHRRAVRRARTVVPTPGADYRSTVAVPKDPARTRRAAVRAFVMRASVVSAAALLLVAVAHLRIPEPERMWGRDQSPFLKLRAEHVAALLEGGVLCLAASIFVVTVFPTRRRVWQ